MFCMQYFLPLVFFPKPASSPWLTFSFILGLYLHHKPCFYCAILFLVLLAMTCDISSEGCWLSIRRAHPLPGHSTSVSSSSSLSSSSSSFASSSCSSSSCTSSSAPPTTTGFWLHPVHTNVLIHWPYPPY